MSATPRIALTGMSLESNAFAPVATEADFRQRFYFEGEALLEEARTDHSVIPKEMSAFVRTMDHTGPFANPRAQSPWLDIHPDSGGDNALEQLAGAAVRYRMAVGPLAGRKTMTLHRPGAVSSQCAPAKTLSASRDGFSLNGAVVCQAHQRDQLERLCRYVSRGPIALERLSIDGDGLGVNAQGSAGAAKHMYKCRGRQDAGSDLFEPLDFAASAHPCARGMSASLHVMTRL